MKHVISIVLLLANIVITSSAIETISPEFKKSGTNYVLISSIDVDLDETNIYIDCSPYFQKKSSSYYPFYGNSVHNLSINIDKNIIMTYIDPINRQTIKVNALELYAFGDNKLFFNKNYYLNDFLQEDGKYYPYISIVFPPLPEGVDTISIYEDETNKNNGWWWENIYIKPLTIGKTTRLVSDIDSINTLIKTTKSQYAGIYEKVGTDNGGIDYTLAYLQYMDKDYLVYIKSDDINSVWKIGEVKAELRSSANSGTFKATWYNRDKSENSKCVVSFDNSIMKVFVNDEIDTYIKMNNGDNNSFSSNQALWSGTGFALNKGYVVTNYHVVNEATSIEIFGINKDISKAYKADVVGVDKVNDLALLKIKDDAFTSFGNIPYNVKQTMAEVGEDIFVLGYPLTTTMGTEVKLTNGIISSRSGFDGDIALYQISAPIQPGNSGGPLFDKKGNLIGVICAKHLGAENAGYAIKMSYLKNLVESVADISILPTKNNINTTELKEQVKQISPYVFLIKCSK